MQPDVSSLVKLVVILTYLAHCVYKPQACTSTHFQTICRQTLSLCFNSRIKRNISVCVHGQLSAVLVVSFQ